MTDKKVLEVLERYEAKLDTLTTHAHNQHKVGHMQEMIPQMRTFLADAVILKDSPNGEAIRQKAHRWLGFMQGTFWSMGIYTIDEMTRHNREED